MKIALNGTFQTTDATYLPLTQINSTQVSFEAVGGVLKHSEVPTRAQIDSYIRKEAIKNNLPPSWVTGIVRCESGFQIDVYGDNGKAYGLFQFHEKTFERFKNESKMNVNYKNWKDQVALALWALKNNKWTHWTCAKYFSVETS